MYLLDLFHDIYWKNIDMQREGRLRFMGISVYDILFVHKDAQIQTSKQA